MTTLAPLGAAVRAARVARGETIRAVAERSGVSERFLSDLERGRGNISIARLMSVARALSVGLAELVAPLDRQEDRPIIALVGLRGAGKTTIGRRVADALDRPFLELDDAIAAEAGLPLSQIFEIHGDAYYRRLERTMLEQVLRDVRPPGLVLAAGGGLVTDPTSWSLLKARARTVWLQAEPDDHYQRVMAQGDLRPMKNRPMAMAELQGLLSARTPLYAEAEARFDTSALGIANSARAICEVMGAIGSTQTDM